MSLLNTVTEKLTLSLD